MRNSAKETLIDSSFSRVQRSLVTTSLEIGRVLADRNSVTFRAQGTCMYPTIRAGDVLHIKPCSIVDIVIGDIAVCRRPDFLFSHRVIEKGSHEGRTYIVTRPDRNKNGYDGPTVEENLLGVVVEIRRKGKSVPLQLIEYPWVIWRCFNLRLALAGGKQHLIWHYADRVTHKNEYVFIKMLTRIWFLMFRPRINFSIQVPMQGVLGEALHRPLKVDEFDLSIKWNGIKIQRWTLLLHIKGKPKPVAMMTFVIDADENWQVEHSYTRRRYQGLGLEETLKTRADAIIKIHN